LLVLLVYSEVEEVLKGLEEEKLIPGRDRATE
jgi:hypothetical protein